MAGETGTVVGLVDVTAGRDSVLAERLAGLVNEVYATAESGLWQDGAGRTTAAEMAELVAAGQIAVATASDGRIVGGVRVRRVDEDADEFGMLVAAPDHRGTGVGRALLDFVEQRGRDRGMRAIQLELLVPRGWRHPSKEFLKAWYGRRGYRRIETRRMEDSHPHLAPLLATPCDLEVYEKVLSAEVAPSAESLKAAAGDLAFQLAESGPTGVEDELARFVRAARRYGVDPLLGSIVLDRGESSVTRQRAFGTLHQQVARLAEEPRPADRAYEPQLLST
jgi:GNAT superfamily N-acetyltransferase